MTESKNYSKAKAYCDKHPGAFSIVKKEDHSIFKNLTDKEFKELKAHVDSKVPDIGSLTQEIQSYSCDDFCSVDIDVNGRPINVLCDEDADLHSLLLNDYEAEIEWKTQDYFDGKDESKEDIGYLDGEPVCMRFDRNVPGNTESYDTFQINTPLLKDVLNKRASESDDYEESYKILLATSEKPEEDLIKQLSKKYSKKEIKKKIDDSYSSLHEKLNEKK